jgi:hypothetical protein
MMQVPDLKQHLICKKLIFNNFLKLEPKNALKYLDNQDKVKERQNQDS